MFKKWTVYMGANDYVEMNDGLDSSMLASLGQRRRRRFLTGICLVLALFIGAAWTASTPRAFQWLARVAPPLAQVLSPSASGREKDGIRVQVVEVTREGDALHIHLTLEDLEGDRLSTASSIAQWEYAQDRAVATGPRTLKYDEEAGLLHLYLTCKPAEKMPAFDWERWVKVTIFDLRTPHGTISGPWSVRVSPITGE